MESQGVYDQKVILTVKELLKTEHDYIQTIGIVKQEYIPYIQTNPIPGGEDKVRLIFANIVQIHEWHQSVFYNELVECHDDPFRIAQAFTQYTRDFHMYVRYCENSTRANLVAGENEQYFLTMMDLNPRITRHVKDIIIRPVQRIMKYQLLLEIVKKGLHKDGFDVAVIQEAIQAISSIPANANDMMSVTRIRGFPGKITAQGPLLLQNSVHVAEAAEFVNRQVFLFEQGLVITTVSAPTKRFDLPNYEHVAGVPINILDIKITEQHKGNQFLIINSKTLQQFLLRFTDPSTFEAWLNKIESMIVSRCNFLSALVDPSMEAAPVKHLTYEMSPIMSFCLAHESNDPDTPTISAVDQVVGFVGHAMVMRGEFFGRPYPTVRWTRDGVELTSVEYGVYCTHLKISSLVEEDQGEYVMEVSNMYGSVRATGLLTVDKGNLCPREIPKVQSHCPGTITVDWTDTYVKKIPNVTYDVEMATAETGPWLTIALNLDCSYYNVNALSSTQTYTFRIVPVLNYFCHPPSPPTPLIRPFKQIESTNNYILRSNISKYYTFPSKHKFKQINTRVKYKDNSHMAETIRDHGQIGQTFQLIKQLRSEHILTLFDCFVTPRKTVTLIFEDVLDDNLLRYMSRYTDYPQHTVLFFMAQLIRALHFLQQHNIRHCNIKPESLYVHRHKSHTFLKLGGFQFISDHSSLPTYFIPDRDYSAPELITGKESHANSDIWSAGAVLNTLLVAKPETNSDKDEAIFQMVRQMMETNPDIRSSAETCLQKIHAFIPEEVITCSGKTLASYLAKREKLENSCNII